MSKLVISVDDKIVNQCFLERGVFSIGRGDRNALKLEDPMISREHAQITTVMQDHILADLGSANGTVVNGAAIDKHILQHGDVIELGRFRLKYLNPKVVHGAAFDRTIMTPSAQPGGVEPVAETSVPARKPRSDFPVAALQALNGNKAGDEARLDRLLFVVGNPGKQLAVINRRPQGYFITHVLGRKTPRVNGKQIGLEPQALSTDDVIEIAGSRFRFFLKRI